MPGRHLSRLRTAHPSTLRLNPTPCFLCGCGCSRLARSATGVAPWRAGAQRLTVAARSVRLGPGRWARWGKPRRLCAGDRCAIAEGMYRPFLGITFGGGQRKAGKGEGCLIGTILESHITLLTQPRVHAGSAITSVGGSTVGCTICSAKPHSPLLSVTVESMPRRLRTERSFPRLSRRLSDTPPWIKFC